VCLELAHHVSRCYRQDFQSRECPLEIFEAPRRACRKTDLDAVAVADEVGIALLIHANIS
jgi:hypothetical protein